MVQTTSAAALEDQSAQRIAELKTKSSGLENILALAVINQRDKITTFEELGWFDPSVEQKLAQKQTLNWLKAIQWSRDIYPDH